MIRPILDPTDQLKLSWDHWRRSAWARCGKDFLDTFLNVLCNIDNWCTDFVLHQIRLQGFKSICQIHRWLSGMYWGFNPNLQNCTWILGNSWEIFVWVKKNQKVSTNISKVSKVTSKCKVMIKKGVQNIKSLYNKNPKGINFRAVQSQVK